MKTIEPESERPIGYQQCKRCGKHFLGYFRFAKGFCIPCGRLIGKERQEKKEPRRNRIAT